MLKCILLRDKTIAFCAWLTGNSVQVQIQRKEINLKNGKVRQMRFGHPFCFARRISGLLQWQGLIGSSTGTRRENGFVVGIVGRHAGATY